MKEELEQHLSLEQQVRALSAIDKLVEMKRKPKIVLADFLAAVSDFSSTFMIKTEEGRALLQAAGKDSRVWVSLVDSLVGARNRGDTDMIDRLLPLACHLGLEQYPETAALIKRLEEEFPSSKPALSSGKQLVPTGQRGVRRGNLFYFTRR